MEHVVNLPGNAERDAHILFNESKIPVLQKVGDIRFLACDKIVNSDDLMAPLDEAIANIAGDKTSATCHKGYFLEWHMSPIYKAT